MYSVYVHICVNEHKHWCVGDVGEDMHVHVHVHVHVVVVWLFLLQPVVGMLVFTH